MTWGGSRAGAGRKKDLALFDRIAVGARCDEVQSQAALKEGTEIYEAQPHILEARRVQDRLAQIQPKLTPVDESPGPIDLRVENRRKELAAKVDHAFDGRARSATISGVRTLTRADVCKKVAKQFSITPRQVESCWKEYRRTLKRAEDELSGV